MAIDMKRCVSAMLAAVAAVVIASCSGDDASNEHDAPDASAGAGGEAGESGQGGSGGDDVVGLIPVPATVTAFTTLGAPRSGDGVTLSGDGFEHGERRCTANGLFCVTGGFEP